MDGGCGCGLRVAAWRQGECMGLGGPGGGHARMLGGDGGGDGDGGGGGGRRGVSGQLMSQIEKIEEENNR